MQAEWLKPDTPTRTALEVCAAMAAVCVLLLFSPAPSVEYSAPTVVAYHDGDADGAAAPGHDTADWPRLPVHAVPRPHGIGWIRWDNPPLPASGMPLAVRTNGPFSATLYWNGTEIGRKGRIATTAGGERAGEIDGLYAIPPDLIRPDGNILAMAIASHRAGYEPASIVQSLRILPYSSDARRSLRYYLPIILIAGVLVAIAAMLTGLMRQRRERRAIWLIVSVSGLLLAGLAETSRAMIDYPYDWHQPRQAVVLLGLGVFATGLLRFCQLRWPAPPRLAHVWLASSLGLALLAAVLLGGYDGKSMAATIVLLTAASAWCLWRGGAEGRIVGLGLVWFPLIAAMDPSEYLDRSIYALALTAFGIWLLRASRTLLPGPASNVRRPVLQVQSSGRAVILPKADIVFVKAAGNYTEIHTANGSMHLDNRNLSTLLGELGEPFFRLHRSYAVNLGQAAAIVSAEGSRYHLETTSGRSIPVSRSLVSELRRRLGSTEL